MKIALFSDIHSNLPALEAFFDNLDQQSPDAVYCLGDLVGYNIWANEVINAIRKRNIPTIHGSPRKINEYLFEDREVKSTIRMLEQANADILCFGHTHQPYHRILNSGIDGENYFRHLINLGSVGKPKDGDPRGCYVLLEIDEKSSVLNAQSIKVEFIRFKYDVEKAAKAVENSPLPNVFANALRYGN